MSDIIKDYEYKSKILKENGWVTYYNDNNWIRKEWFNYPNLKIECSGVSTDIAFKPYSQEEKENDEEFIKIYKELKNIKLNNKKDEYKDDFSI